MLITLLTIQWVVQGSHVQAQQDFNTQYFVNLPAFNPGFTGMESFGDLRASYPQRLYKKSEENSNFYTSYYGVIGTTTPAAYKNNALRISDPDAYDQLSESKDLNRKHGLGGRISSRNLGPFKSLDISVNYAYHLPISQTFTLTLGTQLGFLNHRITFSDFTVRDEVNDLFFQMLTSANEGNQSFFTLDLGSVLYSKEFYFGLSTNSLVNQKVSGDDFNEFLTEQSYTVLTGFKKQLSPTLELYPSARINYSELFDVNWEANVRVRYKEMIYIGGSYENDIRASLLFGIMSDGKYSINYSFDYYLTQLNNFNSGNHEIVVGLALFNKHSLKYKNW